MYERWYCCLFLVHLIYCHILWIPFSSYTSSLLQDGATALFLASQEGHVTVIRQLLSTGAKVNQPREVCSLVLISSVWFAVMYFTVFSVLIVFWGQDGTAPLWMAAQMGHSEVVKVLLLRGADRDADRKVCSKRFIFPISLHILPWCESDCSARWKRKEAYKNAWSVWLRPGLLYYLWCFWLKDGSTALFKAAHKGHCNVIEELLKFSPSLGLLKVRQHHLTSKTSRKWFSCDCVCLVLQSRTVLQLFMLPSWAGIQKLLNFCWRQMLIQLYPTRWLWDMQIVAYYIYIYIYSYIFICISFFYILFCYIL